MTVQTNIAGGYFMKSLYEETGGTYHQEGDYLLPDLVAPESIPIGIWGQRRRRYLREHHNGIYTGMYLVGTRNAHLAQINTQEILRASRLESFWRMN